MIAKCIYCLDFDSPDVTVLFRRGEHGYLYGLPGVSLRGNHLILIQFRSSWPYKPAPEKLNLVAVHRAITATSTNTLKKNTGRYPSRLDERSVTSDIPIGTKEAT